MMKLTRLFVFALTIIVAAPVLADDDDDDDDDSVQEQIDELKDRVGALEEMIGGEDLEIEVSCPANSINEALEAAPLKGRLIISVIGICNENVTIARDYVTLRGLDPDSSKIIGVPETDPFEESPVTLQGAQFISIENLTIGGGGSSGIGASGSFFTVRNSVIENNGLNGIAAFPGSVARVESNVVQGNNTSGVLCRGAVVQIVDSTIQDNVNNGITVETGCQASVGQTLLGVPGGNTIAGNRTGISAASSGSATISNNTIEENADHGVFSNLGGSVVLRNNTIRENGIYGVFVNEGSNGRLEFGNTVESDAPDFSGAAVAVYRNSSLRIRGDGNTLRTTAPFSSSPFLSCNSSEAGGFALDVEMNSTVRQDGGHATVVGNVESFNLSTVDLRDIDITGNVFVDGLNANVRLRDQGTVPGNVTVTGDICLFGPLSVRPFVRVDGFIDCNGGSPPHGVIFENGGFRDCQ